jgi:hypothetical protein
MAPEGAWRCRALTSGLSWTGRLLVRQISCESERNLWVAGETVKAPIDSIFLAACSIFLTKAAQHSGQYRHVIDLP